MLTAFEYKLGDKKIAILNYIIITIFALIPLLFNFPYRVNIYLSWEGAYRMSNGEIPYRDFGLPMGFGFWIVPAIFFKLFGPYMMSLVKAQVFINILSGISFISILNSFKVSKPIQLLSVLVFSLSFTFINFWPWYNHTVIVFQFIGSALLLKYIFQDRGKYSIIYMVVGNLFIFLSFFTKQDAGGLAFMIFAILFLYVSLVEKDWKPLTFYIGSFIAWLLVFFLPLSAYGIGYWFNYGQEPHYSRIALSDFLTTIFGESQWIKFYFLVIAIIAIRDIKNLKGFFFDKMAMVFLLFTVGILFEALLYQVTSYVPPNNNIFFHAFAFAFIFSNLNFKVEYSKVWVISIVLLFTLGWWSGNYWKYLEKVMKRAMPELMVAKKENVVSKGTWSIAQQEAEGKEVKKMDMASWKFSKYKSLKGVYLPKETIDGVNRLFQMDIVKEKGKGLKMLNMSELTSLAYEMGYELSKNGHPLWYHKGVSIFQKEVDQLCSNIRNEEYDIVLFEYLRGLNNFYPFEVRDCLRENYELVDEFPAPRSDGYSPLEVYVRKKTVVQEMPVDANEGQEDLGQDNFNQ